MSCRDCANCRGLITDSEENLRRLARKAARAPERQLPRYMRWIEDAKRTREGNRTRYADHLRDFHGGDAA